MSVESTPLVNLYVQRGFIHCADVKTHVKVREHRRTCFSSPQALAAAFHDLCHAAQPGSSGMLDGRYAPPFDQESP